MTMDDYLAVRMISTPLCLYDCDAPCDGSTAVVVSHVDYAPDAPRIGVPRQRHRHRLCGAGPAGTSSTT